MENKVIRKILMTVEIFYDKLVGFIEKLEEKKNYNIWL